MFQVTGTFRSDKLGTSVPERSDQPSLSNNTHLYNRSALCCWIQITFHPTHRYKTVHISQSPQSTSRTHSVVDHLFHFQTTPSTHPQGSKDQGQGMCGPHTHHTALDTGSVNCVHCLRPYLPPLTTSRLIALSISRLAPASQRLCRFI